MLFQCLCGLEPFCHFTQADDEPYNISDIKSMDEKGIYFFDNYFVSFMQCRKNWAKKNNININDTVCVAVRYINKKTAYFIFDDGKEILIRFNSKGLFSHYRLQKKFMKFQMLLNRYGYASYDLS